MRRKQRASRAKSGCWKRGPESRGMKVSNSIAEYLRASTSHGEWGRVERHGEEISRGEEFTYLGSPVQSNRECGTEVKKRVQADWNGG